MTPEEIKAWMAKFAAAGWTLVDGGEGDFYLFHTKDNPKGVNAKEVTAAQIPAEYDKIAGGKTTGQFPIVVDPETGRRYYVVGTAEKPELMEIKPKEEPTPLDYFPTTPEGIKAANEALASYPPGYRLLQVGQGAVQIFPPEEQKPPSRLIEGLPAATQAAAESLQDDYPSQIGNSGWYELVTRPTTASLKEGYEQALLAGDIDRANELKGYLDQFTEYEKVQLKRQQEQDAEARVAAAEARGVAKASEIAQQKKDLRDYELESYKTQMDAWERAMQLGLGQGAAAQKAKYLSVLGALNPPQFGPEGIPKPDFTTEVGPRPVAPATPPALPAGFESFMAQNTPGAFGQPVPELTPEEKAVAIERYRRQQLALTSPAQAAFRPPPGSTRDFTSLLNPPQTGISEDEAAANMQGFRSPIASQELSEQGFTPPTDVNFRANPLADFVVSDQASLEEYKRRKAALLEADRQRQLLGIAEG